MSANVGHIVPPCAGCANANEVGTCDSSNDPAYQWRNGCCWMRALLEGKRCPTVTHSGWRGYETRGVRQGVKLG